MAAVLGVGDGGITITRIILKREDAVDCLDGSGALQLDDLCFSHGRVGVRTFINGTVAREKSQYVQLKLGQINFFPHPTDDSE